MIASNRISLSRARSFRIGDNSRYSGKVSRPGSVTLNTVHDFFPFARRSVHIRNPERVKSIKFKSKGITSLKVPKSPNRVSIS